MTMRFVGVLIVCLMLLAGVVSVAAQDVPPPDVIGEIPTPDEAGAAFLAALMTLIASVSGGTLVTVIVAFVKRLPPFLEVEAGLIKVVVSIIVVLLGWGANFLGLQAMFGQAAAIIVAVLTVLTGGVSVASHVIYTYGVSGVPIIGTSRDGIPALAAAQRALPDK